MVWEIDPPKKIKRVKDLRISPTPPPPSPLPGRPVDRCSYASVCLHGSEYFWFRLLLFLEEKKIKSTCIIGACSYIPWSSGESILLKWQANNKNKKGSHADSKNLPKCKNKDGYSADIFS